MYMKHPGNILMLFALSIVLAFCSSCAAGDHFEAGHPITKEDLISISAEIFTSADPDPALFSDDLDEGSVYWTPGGSVYHLSLTCRHLKRSKDICHGDLEAAQQAGKEKLCSACRSAQADTEITPDSEPTSTTEGN